MSDDREALPPTVFPDATGTTYHVPWPSGREARYWLVYGVLGPGQAETWGWPRLDGSDVIEIPWHWPRYITTDELRGWLEPMTGLEAARALMQAMADGHPDLFTDTAKPATES